MYVTCLDSDALAVQRLQVGVLKQVHQVIFGGLLQCDNRRFLEPNAIRKVAHGGTLLGNFPHQIALQQQIPSR